jgi:N-acetylglucosamine-6-phosphate deacetylase
LIGAMFVLTGAALVQFDHIARRASLVVDDDRIAAIEYGLNDAPAGMTRIDVPGCYIVPGFVDVHVHGVEGFDTLGGGPAIAEMASRLPRYGVTAFCPTSTACDPATLQQMLASTAAERSRPEPGRARVLPAHLESNFINPAFNGAQPLACLRSPVRRVDAAADGDYSGDDILAVIAAHREDVGIVTIAPEIDGGMDLVQQLTSAGHRVSIGHSGATYEQALEAIAAGVSHATHLFNRMSPMTHRVPGVAGAVLESTWVAAELICDGFHVHPAMMHMAIRAKGVDAVLAITDGTAGSGLPVGTRTVLGGRPIIVTERTAELDDGTVAGSVSTMDAAFAVLVREAGASLVEAARLCATSPARQLGLTESGRIEVGYKADFVVLDRYLRVRDTYVDGVRWGNTARAENV